jgi:hypothetical protein
MPFDVILCEVTYIMLFSLSGCWKRYCCSSVYHIIYIVYYIMLFMSYAAEKYTVVFLCRMIYYNVMYNVVF